jgi:hypothetical protein
VKPNSFLPYIAHNSLIPDDLDNVKNIQDGYKVEPLSAFLGTKAPSKAVAIDFPKWEEGAEYSAQSFNYLDFMLTLVKTPQEEQALMARFAKIGLGDEAIFDLKNYHLRFRKLWKKVLKRVLKR